MSTRPGVFRLAPMSPLILWLTVALLALPPAFVGGAVAGTAQLGLPAIVLAAIYGWVWLRFRPSHFVVDTDSVEVIWPLKRTRIRRADIERVRLIGNDELRRMTGWRVRVGAGGLWGGFGWLWTQKRGVVQMYVSRTDGLVWIERGAARPWLISPDRPQAFVESLTR